MFSDKTKQRIIIVVDKPYTVKMVDDWRLKMKIKI